VRRTSGGRISPSAPEDFWAKVDKSGDCWLWTASRDSHGYGHIGYQRRNWLAHRLSYELVVGPIPDGLSLDHLCRNPPCVRPAHLEPVTHAENLARGSRAAKTHCPKGHPYDEENTRLVTDRRGYASRQCWTCYREYMKTYVRPSRRRAA
jgi:hypothetical protein